MGTTPIPTNVATERHLRVSRGNCEATSQIPDRVEDKRLARYVS